MVIHKHTTKLIYKSRHTISTERIQGHPVLTERCGTQPRGRGLAQFKVITAYQYESTFFNMISAYYLTWWDEVEETYIYIYIYKYTHIPLSLSIYICNCTDFLFLSFRPNSSNGHAQTITKLIHKPRNTISTERIQEHMHACWYQDYGGKDKHS
jgi:hypothetical protein